MVKAPDIYSYIPDLGDVKLEFDIPDKELVDLIRQADSVRASKVHEDYILSSCEALAKLEEINNGQADNHTDSISDLKYIQHENTCEPIRCTACEEAHNIFINAMALAEEEDVEDETGSSDNGTECT